MKYIQDENTNTLIAYYFGAIIIIFLIIKWDIYETKQCEKKGEYRELISKIRLRGCIVILLIGLYATIKDLYCRY
jgi:predicted negative regulator of RcsB-dependent stress response